MLFEHALGNGLGLDVSSQRNNPLSPEQRPLTNSVSMEQGSENVRF